MNLEKILYTICVVFFTTFISFSTNYARVFKVKDEVLKLLELKMKTSELGEGKAVECINRYIEDKISEFDEYAKGMLAFQKPEWDTSNNLFLEII